jgi:hypothetical protein
MFTGKRRLVDVGRCDIKRQAEPAKQLGAVARGGRKKKTGDGIWCHDWSVDLTGYIRVAKIHVLGDEVVRHCLLMDSAG